MAETKPKGSDDLFNTRVSNETGPDDKFQSGYQSSNELDRKNPQLLVFTAPDKKALHRVMEQNDAFYQTNISGDYNKLCQLVYTLGVRRSHMLWRAFTICKHTEQALSITKPVRTTSTRGLVYIFTGQGAQYANMGIELLQYHVFRESLKRADETYASLGCTWSIFGEII